MQAYLQATNLFRYVHKGGGGAEKMKRNRNEILSLSLQ